METNRLKLVFIVISLLLFLPSVIVQSSPIERIILKKPIFGNLILASDLTIDSLMGGKYKAIDQIGPFFRENNHDQKWTMFNR